MCVGLYPLPEVVGAACAAAAAEGPCAAFGHGLQLDVDGIGISVVMVCVVRFTAAQDTQASAALLAARQQG